MFFDRYREKTLLSTCHYLVEATSRKRTKAYRCIYCKAVFCANGFSVI